MGTSMTRITCLACCQHTQQGILEVSIIKRMDILLQLVVHSGVNLKKKNLSLFSERSCCSGHNKFTEVFAGGRRDRKHS